MQGEKIASFLNEFTILIANAKFYEFTNNI